MFIELRHFATMPSVFSRRETPIGIFVRVICSRSSFLISSSRKCHVFQLVGTGTESFLQGSLNCLEAIKRESSTNSSAVRYDFVGRMALADNVVQLASGRVPRRSSRGRDASGIHRSR